MEGTQDHMIQSHRESEVVDARRWDVDFGGVEMIEGAGEADHIMKKSTERKDIRVWAEGGLGLVDFGGGVAFTARAKMEWDFFVIESFKAEDTGIAFITQPDLARIQLEEKQVVFVDGLDGLGDVVDDVPQFGERKDTSFFKSAGQAVAGEWRRKEKDAIFVFFDRKRAVDAGFGKVGKLLVSRAKAEGREFFDDVGSGIFFALEGGFPDHAVVGARDIALE